MLSLAITHLISGGGPATLEMPETYWKIIDIWFWGEGSRHHGLCVEPASWVAKSSLPFFQCWTLFLKAKSETTLVKWNQHLCTTLVKPWVLALHKKHYIFQSTLDNWIISPASLTAEAFYSNKESAAAPENFDGEQPDTHSITTSPWWLLKTSGHVVSSGCPWHSSGIFLKLSQACLRCKNQKCINCKNHCPHLVTS